MEGERKSRENILTALLRVQDIQMILPTALILLLTIIVMLTVIPYAFSSVFKQMEAIRALEEAQESLGATRTKNGTEDL